MAIIVILAILVIMFFACKFFDKSKSLSDEKSSETPNSSYTGQVKVPDLEMKSPRHDIKKNIVLEDGYLDNSNNSNNVLVNNAINLNDI